MGGVSQGLSFLWVFVLGVHPTWNCSLCIPMAPPMKFSGAASSLLTALARPLGLYFSFSFAIVCLLFICVSVSFHQVQAWQLRFCLLLYSSMSRLEVSVSGKGWIVNMRGVLGPALPVTTHLCWENEKASLNDMLMNGYVFWWNFIGR